MKEQVKSGFLIAGKLVAALCIAAAFLSGCALVEEAASSAEIVIGWLLIAVSIVVMAFTVRFWAAGFVGFIAYAALRLLGGTLVARSFVIARVAASHAQRGGEPVCNEHFVHPFCIGQTPHHPKLTGLLFSLPRFVLCCLCR
jgi:hypothetical protein